MNLAHGFRRLPLFWKLLVPYVGLLVIVGTFGAFLITRDLSERARGSLNEQLLQASLRARTLFHEKELYLIESANLAANLEGMAGAVRNEDADSAARLLTSVLALKDELTTLIVTGADGSALVAYARAEPGAAHERRDGGRWDAVPIVDAARTSRTGAKIAGVVSPGGPPALGIAAAICSSLEPCTPVGVALVAMRLDRLAVTATAPPRSETRAALTMFDTEGRVLTTTPGAPGMTTPVRITGDELVRRTERAGDTEVHTLYAPLELQGRGAGMVAVSLPSAPAFASVRGAAYRLIAIMAVALAGIVGVGALLSRFILRQTRPLLATNRALGSGDLSARAPVVTDDEIGELARGLNLMAEQLQAGYETLEMRVEERTREIHRLLQERTEFFASLSHELRTPIALMISHGEMLVDPDFRQTPRTVKQRGEVIRETGKQLLAVVNDILDLARLEAGSIRVEIAETPLRSLVDDLRPTMSGLASAAGLSMEIRVPDDLPPMLADARRLREIVMNLVDNAVKYTRPGGSVTLAASHVEGRVAVTVTDTGVGIPAEAHERIFEPFFRVPGTETQRGQFSTGLGLAISRRLAEAQSGEITVQSVPGEGTTFTVWLPAAGTPLVALSGARRTSGRRARRARGGSPRAPARDRVS